MTRDDIDTTHTCHAECPRPACVAARKAVAKSKNPELQVSVDGMIYKPTVTAIVRAVESLLKERNQ